MSTNVKVLVEVWRQLGVEAADALHRVRPDAAPDTLPHAALRRLIVEFDAETYDPAQLTALRAAFLERWAQVSAR